MEIQDGFVLLYHFIETIFFFLRPLCARYSLQTYVNTCHHFMHALMIFETIPFLSGAHRHSRQHNRTTKKRMDRGKNDGFPSMVRTDQRRFDKKTEGKYYEYIILENGPNMPWVMAHGYFAADSEARCFLMVPSMKATILQLALSTKDAMNNWAQQCSFQFCEYEFLRNVVFREECQAWIKNKFIFHSLSAYLTMCVYPYTVSSCPILERHATIDKLKPKQ